MSTIAQLRAREVLDSRGVPTIEVEARSSCGAVGRATAPSGSSPGRHEARELRDEHEPRFGGRGVRAAVAGVAEHLAPALQGLDLDDQRAIDARMVELDGTPDRSRLGANALVASSMAVAHAAAAARGEELYVHLGRLWAEHLPPGEPAGPRLPRPLINVISGGLHAGGQLDFQDFLLVPLAARDYPEALELAAVVAGSVGSILRGRGEADCVVTDAGSFGPRLWNNSQAVECILEGALACGLEPGRDVAVALDVGATHLYDPETRTYCLSAGSESEYAPLEFIDLLAHWVRQYPIVAIVDGLAQDEWDCWAALTARLGDAVQVVGDDLFATQARRLEHGARLGAANSLMIKPNQVGTLTETLEVLALARRLGYRAIISARSGDAEDATIADLAVATGVGQVSFGALARAERLAKYNRLTRIADQLGPDARFAGHASGR